MRLFNIVSGFLIIAAAISSCTVREFDNIPDANIQSCEGNYFIKTINAKTLDMYPQEWDKEICHPIYENIYYTFDRSLMTLHDITGEIKSKTFSAYGYSFLSTGDLIAYDKYDKKFYKRNPLNSSVVQMAFEFEVDGLVCSSDNFIYSYDYFLDGDSNKVSIRKISNDFDSIYWNQDFPKASLLPTKDGGMLLNASISYSELQLTKINKNGIVQWENTLTYPDNYRILSMKDGSFQLFYSSGSNYMTVKLDTLGNVIYEKEMGNIFYDETKFFATNDNGFIFAISPSADDLTEFSVYKFDSEGNQQWIKWFDGANRAVIGSIVNDLDGGFRLIGNITGFHGTNAYEDKMLLFIKTDSLGNTCY